MAPKARRASLALSGSVKVEIAMTYCRGLLWPTSEVQAMALLPCVTKASPAFDHAGAVTVFGVPFFACTNCSFPRPYVGGNRSAKPVGMEIETGNPTRLTNRRWGGGEAALDFTWAKKEL